MEFLTFYNNKLTGVKSLIGAGGSVYYAILPESREGDVTFENNLTSYSEWQSTCIILFFVFIISVSAPLKKLPPLNMDFNNCSSLPFFFTKSIHSNIA